MVKVEETLDSGKSIDMGDLSSALPPAMAALSVEERAGLVNVLKEKLESLAGEHAAGVLASLSPKVKQRVTVLQELQAEHDAIEAKFFEEKAALEAKYLKLYQPFYQKRFEIVNGITEVEGVEISAPKVEAESENKKAEEGKGVPEFWLSAMKTNEVLAMQITERDEGALRYLKDIKRENLDEPKGFKLEFLFDTNPYFKNTTLTKIYHMIEETEPVLEKAIGTEIEWHQGKNLTQKLLKKKPKKGAKNAKPITKVEKCDSFFNFFNPPQVPEDGEEIDVEKVEELQDLLEQDFDIGSTIRDKIIPHAVSWFTGEAVQGEELYDDDEEDDDEDEYDDEDEDDDEDDDDDDDVDATEGGKGKE